jgi:hypothetical protein
MDERHFKEELSATQPMLQSPIPAEPRHGHCLEDPASSISKIAIPRNSTKPYKAV